MSLDITIRSTAKQACSHCGREADSGKWLYDWNYTYNVSGMIGAAAKAACVATPKDAAAIDAPTSGVLFGHYVMLDGIEGRAGDFVEKLDAIVNELDANPVIYRAMNPDNGWGSYETLVPSLKELLEKLREFPDAIVSTSR